MDRGRNINREDLHSESASSVAAARTGRDVADYLQNASDHAASGRPPRATRQALARVRGWKDRFDEWKLRAGSTLNRFDLTPDLADNIGSARWFRGLVTMLGLGAVALMFWPDLTPLEARSAMPLDDAIRTELRRHAITPLALGADTGRRMAPTDAVIPLASAPERPRIELVSKLAPGDSFASALRRAGVSASDIDRVSALISPAITLSEVEPGTTLDIVLGRRSEQGAPRPLDALSFRARFDLELKVDRTGRDELGNPIGPLALERNPIRVDETPLRLRGKVGSSLYRSMRAAGVPASAVQDYLRALDAQLDMNREVASSDEFDIIIAYRRAATGERQAGQLLYAGIDRGGQPKVQLMRWGSDGRFYEASGTGEERTGLARPVPGAVTSGFGMRRHPILGYRRMHAGLDFRARRGTPIVAVTDGRVVSAGRAGGCGITVKLQHSGNLATRYCHMSRLAVRRGAQVKRGQVIGYVGSTGLSTGPHLHYEMYRGGKAINPASVKYVTRSTLSGTELIDFKRQLIKLKEIEVGVALEDLVPMESEIGEPEREIEKISGDARE
ncbi:MAG: peptidoglycan DD-metalloendopeptidase family protein [Erythrobacter sp.]|uniref:M23 family metallopeptidase n=1 Tax=Erythrobacter sp. TaxID=1042 RepID=UPI0026027E71|nr:M23 family metallopeptidase [Erythrobacter sp.]MDJ0978452.1 peptidoglycan DD-metalloendopeptidase family protein [Erythrobacter sp.]